MERGEGLFHIAAIDIGTNSAHLVIAQVDSGGNLDIKDTYKHVLRLGSYLDPESRALGNDGIDKVVECLRHMREIASAYRPIFRTVCTHAIRASRNFDAALVEIYERTGIRIEAIDGIEEARLASLGIRLGLNLKQSRFLGVDIGGGSTELALVDRGEIKYTTSIQLGAVMLTQEFLSEDRIKKSQIKAMMATILNRLGPLMTELHQLRYDVAVCCSGAAKAIAWMHAREFNSETLADPNGYRFACSELETIHSSLKKLRDAGSIQKEWGLDKNRSEIILAGSSILLQLSKLLPSKEWLVSAYGLREGLLIDTIQRLRTRKSTDPEDQRWASILKLGKKFAVDEVQAKQVLSFALCIFDGLRGSHGKDDNNVTLTDREILTAAAWLHECGQFVSFPRYHKHSAYLIVNGRIFGFTQKERQLIGVVARFHRKGRASRKDHDCRSFTDVEIAKINFLASILRIAVSANRTRRQVFSAVAVNNSAGQVVLNFKARPDKSNLVEVNKIEQELPYLEKILGKKVAIEIE